ncbi:MAG: hypothetical protein IT582_01665 [Opitutaceae bacterium]|nr:hypothetical protein [Opitutaceae bacterium]
MKKRAAKSSRKRPTKLTKSSRARRKVIPEAARVFPARPFPLAAIVNPGDAPHDLGPTQSPADMARADPPGGAWREMSLADATAKAFAALVGSGPQQTPPHFATGEHLRDALARLRDHALTGDAAALQEYAFTVTQAVADLAEMARRHPDLVRPWSRAQNTVPVLTGRNLGHRRELDATLAAFAVGEASPYRVNPAGKRARDVSTPANALAGALCAHLAAHRVNLAIMRPPVPAWARLASALPDFSAKTWRKWEAAAWACLLDATNQHPEALPALAALGTKGARKDGLQSVRTRAANVRAEIHQSLKEAFRGLAAAR